MENIGKNKNEMLTNIFINHKNFAYLFKEENCFIMT